MTEPTVAAIVLAGGRSSRMGQDKALLEIAGIPLLRRVYEAVASWGWQVYVVTPWPDRYRSVLPDTCCLIQEQPLEGANFQGPLVGFAQGLGQVQAEWVFLVACDLPYLAPELLGQGMALLPELAEATIALLPRGAKGWEPLCGFYRRSCLASLQAYIAQGGRAFQPWLAEQAIAVLPVPEAKILLNCNTPADWQMAQQMFNPAAEDSF